MIDPGDGVAGAQDPAVDVDEAVGPLPEAALPAPGSEESAAAAEPDAVLAVAPAEPDAVLAVTPAEPVVALATEPAEPVAVAEETAAAPTPEPRPAPVLLGVVPASAIAGQGLSVSLLGAGFEAGARVLLGGEPLESHRVDAGRIEAMVPPHPPGELALQVVNPDGQEATRERALRFDEAPLVIGVSPEEGPVTGGTPVTLTGRALAEGCAVEIAGVRLADVTRAGSTTLLAVTPAGAAGTSADVTVVNPNGLRHTLRGAFTYRALPPRLLSVTPASGPSAGGTRLTLVGDGFHELSRVLVCGLEVAVGFKAPGELDVITAPVSRDGPVDVKVLNPDGQASALAAAFRYVAALPPPVLLAVSPARGGQAGGLSVRLLGDDLHEQVVVRFGAAPAKVRYLTRKEIEVTTPASPLSGEVAVEVVNPDGAIASLPAGFVYEAKPAPGIASVHPPNGPTTGGTRLVIEGTNFADGLFVYVGRELPKDVVVKSATEIHVVTAARKAAGVVDVEVLVPDAPKAVLKNGFRYDAVAAPVIRSVAPTAGAVAGGTVLTIEGLNFLKESSVLLDGRPVKAVKLVDRSTLEVKTPGGDAGRMIDVAVRNPDGKEAVQKRAFLYDPRYR